MADGSRVGVVHPVVVAVADSAAVAVYILKRVDAVKTARQTADAVRCRAARARHARFKGGAVGFGLVTGDDPGSHHVPAGRGDDDAADGSRSIYLTNFTTPDEQSEKTPENYHVDV